MAKTPEIKIAILNRLINKLLILNVNTKNITKLSCSRIMSLSYLTSDPLLVKAPAKQIKLRSFSLLLSNDNIKTKKGKKKLILNSVAESYKINSLRKDSF